MTQTIDKDRQGAPRADRTIIRCGIAAFMAWVLVFLAAGCGVKAPPVPPGQPELPAVTTLTVTLRDNVAILQWQNPPQAARIAGYAVYREQKPLDSEPCDTCPRTFETVGKVVRIASAASQDFADPLAAGYRYSYKLNAYASSGAQGPDSNIVSVAVATEQP